MERTCSTNGEKKNVPILYLNFTNMSCLFDSSVKTLRFVLYASVYILCLNIRPVIYFGSPFWLTTAQFHVWSNGRIEILFKEDLNNLQFASPASANSSSAYGRALLILFPASFIMVSSLAYSWVLKVYATYCSETPVNFTRLHRVI